MPTVAELEYIKALVASALADLSKNPREIDIPNFVSSVKEIGEMLAKADPEDGSSITKAVSEELDPQAQKLTETQLRILQQHLPALITTLNFLKQFTLLSNEPAKQQHPDIQVGAVLSSSVAKNFCNGLDCFLHSTILVSPLPVATGISSTPDCITFSFLTHFSRLEQIEQKDKKKKKNQGRETSQPIVEERDSVRVTESKVVVEEAEKRDNVVRVAKIKVVVEEAEKRDSVRVTESKVAVEEAEKRDNVCAAKIKVVVEEAVKKFIAEGVGKLKLDIDTKKYPKTDPVRIQLEELATVLEKDANAYKEAVIKTPKQVKELTIQFEQKSREKIGATSAQLRNIPKWSEKVLYGLIGALVILVAAVIVIPAVIVSKSCRQSFFNEHFDRPEFCAETLKKNKQVLETEIADVKKAAGCGLG